MLDQVPVPAGSSGADAVAATLELAVAAEALGYRRYWVAEHHNTPSLASASPEVLVAAVAARTTCIRVGSGGVLLSHYSPLKVAETFRLLDALAPGRVDLGVGRTPGADPVTEAALQYRPGTLGDEHFAHKMVDLLGFLDGDLGPGHPYASVRAVPAGERGPDVWVLGSSSTGAAAAAYLGLPFAFAHFITDRFGPQILQSYRKGFTPTARTTQPRALVAVSVVCADTDAEAARLATSVDVWRLRPEGGERGPLLPPDEAAAVPLSELDRARVAQHRAGTVVGDPASVRSRLEELAGSFGVDELVVLTVCHDPAARLRSYQLVAEAFGLR
ncbi:MAG: LLM class flavin-dependent oxidoreductase [Actinomycetota bacterium]|nr:LLM class flavin-dependent oxidoreductase [Actinomycetota bacterium]